MLKSPSRVELRTPKSEARTLPISGSKVGLPAGGRSGSLLDMARRLAKKTSGGFGNDR